MQTIFHTEISNSVSGHLLLSLHIFLKMLIHFLQLFHKAGIILQLFITIQRNRIQQYNRIVTTFPPFVHINHPEKFTGFIMPTPPEILRYSFQCQQFFRNRTMNHNTDPTRIIHSQLLFDKRQILIKVAHRHFL